MSTKDRKDASSRKRSKSHSPKPASPPSGKEGRKDAFDPFLTEELPDEELEQPDSSEPDDEAEASAAGETEQEESPEPDDEAEASAAEELQQPSGRETDEEPNASSRDGPATPPLEKPKMVLMTEKVSEPILRDPARTGSTILVVIGGALCLLWLTEMLLLWVPLYLRNPAWTFGTVVRTVDILPSAAVGGALLTYGLIRHPGAPTRIVRRLSTAFAALAALFVLITFFYMASLPASFAQAPEVSVQPLRRTVVQTIVALLIGTATCSGVATLLWRAVRKSSRTVGP